MNKYKIYKNTLTHPAAAAALLFLFFSTNRATPLNTISSTNRCPPSATRGVNSNRPHFDRAVTRVKAASNSFLALRSFIPFVQLSSPTQLSNMRVEVKVKIPSACKGIGRSPPIRRSMVRDQEWNLAEPHNEGLLLGAAVAAAGR